MYFTPQRRTFFGYRNFKKCSEILNFLAFWFGNALLATAACNFSISELQKVVWECQSFSILISKYISRHSGVQFCNIWTSKNGLRMSIFLHFDFKIHFSPQRRAIFQHLNFKNVLLATMACNFWFLLWLRTRRFNEPTFRFTRHTNHWKNTAFRDFSNIWCGWGFFFLIFALLHLFSSDFTLSSDFTSSLCFSSAFQFSILSEVYYLNFLWKKYI